MFTELATFATEPELKTVQIGDSERSVMNGRIAINQGKDRAAFVNVTAWGKLAEYMFHFQSVAIAVRISVIVCK